MIPNVGNTSFYLRVLICDLARTILTEFENIVRMSWSCDCDMVPGFNDLHYLFFMFCLHNSQGCSNWKETGY